MSNLNEQKGEDLAIKRSDLLCRLSALNTDEKQAAYVQWNRFEWPQAVVECKPKNWDEMDDKEKHKSNDGKSIAWAIFQVISEFDRSQGWWRIALNRTDEEHAEWYVKNHS